MKVIHVSTSDRIGGACIAGFRQHVALLRAGIDSRMVVLRKTVADQEVETFCPTPASTSISSRASRLVSRTGRRIWNAPHNFFDRNSRFSQELTVMLREADIVNLQHVFGIADYSNFLNKLPPSTSVVVTMHDLSAFTGGCFYPGDCLGYESNCNKCPMLTRHSGFDPARQGFQRRRVAYERNRQRLRFVADSHWLAEAARSSALLANFDVKAVHYGIDTDVFKPQESAGSRQQLGIPEDSIVIGFSAADVSNPRKGMRYLLAAIDGIAKGKQLTQKDIFLLSWGQSIPDTLTAYPHLHLGSLTSDRLMAMAYGIVDIFVVPSTEEAFGQTALEASSCGTSVIAFATGGIVDIVKHETNGLLARKCDTEDLTACIVRLAKAPDERARYAIAGRQIAQEQFSYGKNANAYIALYEQLLKRS